MFLSPLCLFVRRCVPFLFDAPGHTIRSCYSPVRTSYSIVIIVFSFFVCLHFHDLGPTHTSVFSDLAHLPHFGWLRFFPRHFRHLFARKILTTFFCMKGAGWEEIPIASWGRHPACGQFFSSCFIAISYDLPCLSPSTTHLIQCSLHSSPNIRGEIWMG